MFSTGVVFLLHVLCVYEDLTRLSPCMKWLQLFNLFLVDCVGCIFNQLICVQNGIGKLYQVKQENFSVSVISGVTFVPFVIASG